MKINAAFIVDFLENVKAFRNKNGVIIGMTDKVFRVYVVLGPKTDGAGIYTLQDEVFGVEKFMEAYAVHSVKDLDLIMNSNIWFRYLVTESAQVIYMEGDKPSIHFRKFGQATMVFSESKNFYRQVDKVFNMRIHFKTFIEDNEEALLAKQY